MASPFGVIIAKYMQSWIHDSCAYVYVSAVRPEVSAFVGIQLHTYTSIKYRLLCMAGSANSKLV